MALADAIRGRPASFLAVALGLACLAAFAAIARDLGNLAPLDAAVVRALAAHRSGALTAVALDVTALGSPIVLGLFTTLLALALARLGHPRSARALVVAALGAGVWTTALKNAFVRPRPALVSHLAGATGYSFPSGHSLASAAIYGTAAVIVAVNARRRGERVLVGAVTAGLLAAIGASRVYLGVHYPSDVLAGYAAGLAWAFGLLAAASFTQRAAGGAPAAPPGAGESGP